ncbi:unnamed protein product, partial [Discosporangium mesarthrocarpum]
RRNGGESCQEWKSSNSYPLPKERLRHNQVNQAVACLRNCLELSSGDPRECFTFSLPTLLDFSTLALSKIPKGKVSTYGGLAKALGTCPRAVGGALRRNPYAPVVPCHRIVSGDLTIGGFSGSKGDCENTRRKRAMLEAEGVVFNGDKVKYDGVS